MNQQLREVLESKCFERAGTLRALLLYLWENKDKEISEYAIAVEALHRNEDFESKIDATVRVQIWRLRRFLAKYYETEGSQSRVRLSIPLGTHQIQLIEFTPESEPENTVETQEEPLAAEMPPAFASILPPPETFIRRNNLWVSAVGSIVVILGFCIGGFLWSAIHDHARVNAAQRELPLFWKRFMDNGKPARIILSSPVFFAWNSEGKNDFLVVRDVSVRTPALVTSEALS